MKLKYKILPGLVIIISLLLSTLSFPGKEKAEKTLHFAIPLPFEFTYDPVEGNYINLQSFFRATYSTLFKLDQYRRPYPFLLETYNRSGKIVTLQLKKVARFSDGSDITSADVVQSIEAGMRHTSYPNAIYKMIQGGEEFFQGKTNHCSGIKIIDAKRFQIILENENDEYCYYFTSIIMSILPSSRNRDKDKLLFSGPFQVVRQEQQKSQLILTLKRNPWYFGDTPKLDTLVIHIYLDDTAFERTILRGEPDIFLYNNRQQMLESRYKYNYLKTPICGGFYFKLNPISGPFKDKRLRTFFKYFVRSQVEARNENWVLSTPVDLVLPYNLTGYFVFNPIPHENFKPFAPTGKVTIKCINPRFGIREELFSLLKKKLKKFNVSLDLQWSSMPNILGMERKGSLDLTSVYYISDVPLSFYFYETLFLPGHELNLFGYEAPEALELLDTYRKEIDEIKKLKILARLEEIAQEEAFLIPLFNQLTILGYKSQVKNVNIDKLLNINFEEIDVKNK
ncbi:MAG: peptide/nickel transport system substrate-binding protein [Acidobacteriota bacterium]|nr:peptide/nickel transport system substrate-binding protein [Acidobacteriota bacterium]